MTDERLSKVEHNLHAIKASLLGELDGEKRGLIHDTTVIRRDLDSVMADIKSIKDDVASIKKDTNFNRGFSAGIGALIGTVLTLLANNILF